jgi:homoserine kinase type II
VTCNGRELVLTVLDNHDWESATTVARLLRHLDINGVTVGSVVQATDGEDLTRFESRPVLLRHYVRGVCHDLLPSEWLPEAGRVLASIHAVPPPDHLPSRSRRLPSDALDRIGSFTDRAFADWLLRRLEQAEPLTRLDEPRGLVHGDYFSDNLVVTDEGGIGVLDWETATRDLFVLDLGMAIVGLCRWEGEFLPDRARRLLSGYQQSRELGSCEGAVLWPATLYAAVVIAYHRYLRHHVLYPDPAKQQLYLEIPKFIESCEQRWDEARLTRMRE